MKEWLLPLCVALLILAVSVAFYQIGMNKGLREIDSKTITDLRSELVSTRKQNASLVGFANEIIKIDSSGQILELAKKRGLIRKALDKRD